ncbi:hypothetical protein SNEBB_005535 [Seison nebaliae]|nr:hypothetical protein SNEBB_005535 [Seison nebaliae]
MNSIKLLISDVRGVLLQYRETPGKVYSRIGHSIGLNADPDAIDKIYPNFFSNYRTKYPVYGSQEGWSVEYFWERLAKDIMCKSILNEDYCTIRHLMKNFDHTNNDHLHLLASTHFDGMNEMSLKEIDMIERYSEKNNGQVLVRDETLNKFTEISWKYYFDASVWKMLPNVKETLVRSLNAFGFNDIVDHIIIASIVKKEKPQLEFIRHGINESGIGLEDMSQIMYVGDSYLKDYLPAKQLGIESNYLISSNEKHPDVKEEYQIKKFSEILKKL